MSELSVPCRSFREALEGLEDLRKWERVSSNRGEVGEERTYSLEHLVELFRGRGPSCDGVEEESEGLSEGEKVSLE